MRRIVRSGVFVILASSLGAPGIAQEPSPEWTAADYFMARQEAEAYLRNGDSEPAAAIARRLVDFYPHDPEVWYGLGLAEAELENLSGAIEAWERSHDLGYWYPERTASRIARLHARLGDGDAAIAWLERSVAEGMEDRPPLQTDEVFAELRGDPRFVDIAALPPEEGLSRDERFRYDLDFLVREAQRLNKHPDRPAYGEPFLTAARELAERIPDLTDEQVFVEMSALVALLGDGHSVLYPAAAMVMFMDDPQPPYALNTLPVLLYQFTDGLFVIRGEGEASRWVGHRVVAFGPLTVEEILSEAAPRIPKDTEMGVRWIAPLHYLRNMALLEAVGVTEGPNRVSITLEAPNGDLQEVLLEGGIHKFPWKLSPPGSSSDPAPLWLRDVGTSYWSEPLQDANALYVQFNQVRDMEEESIEAFAGRIHQTLGSSGVNNLIVDVRHNNGGNNFLVRPMIRMMIAFEMASSANRVYVLTGRNTFSAAQNFINRVDRYTDAIFAGERSSSRPNISGEENTLVLPYSGIRGSLSSRYWQDSDPPDHRRWIAPDIPVRLSSDDYFGNRDPVLEAVAEVIQRSGVRD